MQRKVSANHPGVMQHFFANRPSSLFSLSVGSILMLTSENIIDFLANMLLERAVGKIEKLENLKMKLKEVEIEIIHIQSWKGQLKLENDKPSWKKLNEIGMVH